MLKTATFSVPYGPIPGRAFEERSAICHAQSLILQAQENRVSAIRVGCGDGKNGSAPFQNPDFDFDSAPRPPARVDAMRRKRRGAKRWLAKRCAGNS
jgi:hypothetical protein